MISLNTRHKYHEARNPAKEMNTIKHVDKSPYFKYYVNIFFISSFSSFCKCSPQSSYSGLHFPFSMGLDDECGHFRGLQSVFLIC